MTALVPAAVFPPDDLTAAAHAVDSLENAGVAIRLAELAGLPVAKSMSALPSYRKGRFDRIVANAILKCQEAAIGSMDGGILVAAPSVWVPRWNGGMARRRFRAAYSEIAQDEASPGEGDAAASGDD